MKFDRLSLILLLAIGVTRVLPVDATLSNVLVLPFLIRVTLSMRTASFMNQHPARLADNSTEVRYYSNAA